MKIKSFLKLVEIQTKVASVIPFFLGLAYAAYNFGKLSVVNSVVMFFSMIIFDMTVTALNNYFDYKRAVKKHGFGYEEYNSIVRDDLKQSKVVAAIVIMLIVSVALGLYLVYLTDYIVLLLGLVCFAVGIVYSFGPLPISRTPFGEVFSGGVMGFIIPFIVVYINGLGGGMITLSLNNFVLAGSIDLLLAGGLLAATIPAVFAIANIMLANNICDMEDDLTNKRYTLPLLIGKAKSLILLKVLFYLSYAAVVVGVIGKVLPIYSLLVILTLIPVNKKIKAFTANPTKRETFGFIVECFLIINVSLILTIAAGIAVNALF